MFPEVRTMSLKMIEEMTGKPAKVENMQPILGETTRDISEEST
jgi:hypothetical protein